MQLKLKTILNLKEPHPHFVYNDIRLAKTPAGQGLRSMLLLAREVKALALGATKNALAMID